LPVYFTLNTGQNIHLIVEGKNAAEVVKKLKELPNILEIIENKASDGARLTSSHLF
jgi:mevalonate pyrophosphate decarboxylase